MIVRPRRTVVTSEEIAKLALSWMRNVKELRKRTKPRRKEADS